MSRFSTKCFNYTKEKKLRRPVTITTGNNNMIPDRNYATVESNGPQRNPFESILTLIT